MRVLLVYPPTFNSIQSILPESVEENRGAFPPLGILYIASKLKELEGVTVSAIDAPTQGLSSREIVEKIKEEGFELVGISILSFHLIDALELAMMIKNEAKSCIVVAGGVHPHIYPEETLALGAFDYVIRGEAELSFFSFIEALIKGKPIDGIPGLFSKTGQKGVEPQLIEDLSQLPFPLRNLVPIEKYHSVLSGIAPITTMISSRGCSYKCIFCDRPHLGKKFRARSAKDVVLEMEACKELGIKEVVFYDDNFSHSRERVLEIAELILEKKLNMLWDIRARVGDLKPEDYIVLKKAGLDRIHFGVESGDEEILEKIKKGINLKRAKEAFSSARKAGIETLAYFMIGLPEETENTLQKTIDFASELKPDYVHFSILMLFPATPVYRMALERGILERDVWKEFAKSPDPGFKAPVWEENFKRDELLMALRKAYRAFYINPKYLWRSLRRVRNFNGFKNNIKMGLRIIGMRG